MAGSSVDWLTPVIQALSETAGMMAGRPPIVVGRAIRQMSSDPIIERAR
jgi:hypothetical protein